MEKSTCLHGTGDVPYCNMCGKFLYNVWINPREVLRGGSHKDIFGESLRLLSAGLSQTWIFSDLGFFFVMYVIQHCFIYRPSDSTVPEDAGIEPMTVAT